MTDKDAEDNLGDRSPAGELPLPNINMIWDLRILLNSSEERLSELNSGSSPDNESMQLERAIIRGVSKEIKRLEREVLYCDPFLQ